MSNSSQLDDLDDLSDLVVELRNTKSLTGVTVPSHQEKIATVPENINDSNVNEFIFKKASVLIQQGIDTVESLKRTVLSGADAETIDAFSKLMSSVANSIEILNKVNLQNRKEIAAKALKQMSIDNPQKMLGGGAKIETQNNTILVASREEIIKALINKADGLKTEANNTIDVDSN